MRLNHECRLLESGQLRVFEANPVSLGGHDAGGGLGSHTSGVRRGLTGALEADIATAAQDTTAPDGSVIEMIVLLKVDLM